MAFADPQSVTINAVAKSLPEFNRGTDRAVYKHATEEIELEVRKDFRNTSFRTQVKLTQRKTGADALNPATNKQYECDAYLVIRGPRNIGFTATEVAKNVEGLVDWLSDANIVKLIGGEI